MVGALIVTLLVILAYVGFRALNRTDLDVKPEHVDYLAQVEVRAAGGSDVVYPSRLPSAGTPPDHAVARHAPEMELSMLTGHGSTSGRRVAGVDAGAAHDVRRPAPAGRCPGRTSRSLVGRWDTWTGQRR
jgi:hypothetical protein